MSKRFVEILNFTYYYKHFVFIRNADGVMEKHVRDAVEVSVGVNWYR